MPLRRIAPSIGNPNSWITRTRETNTIAEHALRLGIIAGLLTLAALTVTYTGGTPNAYAHLFYLPVLASGYYYGIAGAAITGVAAGIIAGPLIPTTIQDPRAATMSWLTRMVFLVFIGVVATALIDSRERGRTRLRDLVRELYHAYGKSLQTFAALVAQRDEQTSHHCERVAHNARVLGQAIGLEQHELIELYWSGILHDLGKIGTPARILLKPGTLTPAEYAEIKKHAAVGADILSGISPRFLEISVGVRSHHERWDGSGYPDGLRARDIPLHGRILAIVDVFEALTSDRPYRSPMKVEAALAAIENGAGNHFDPNLVDTFMEQYEQGKILVEGDPIPAPDLEHYPVPGYATLVREVQLE